MSAHHRLRSETRAAHERVDARFSDLDLEKREDYRRFIGLHGAAFLPIEQALSEAGAERLVPDWQAMRRSSGLLADLQDLGLAIPPAAPVPAFGSDEQLLGAIYVLEGSRLGGAVLRRTVDPAFPQHFLGHPQPPGRWRELVALLERKLYQPVQVDSAVAAALGVFAYFEQAEWDAA